MKSEVLLELIAKEPINESDLFSKLEEDDPNLSLNAFTIQLHRLKQIHLIQIDIAKRYTINPIMLKEQVEKLEDIKYEYDLPDKVIKMVRNGLYFEIILNYIPEETINKAKIKVRTQAPFLKEIPDKKLIEIIKKTEVINNE